MGLSYNPSSLNSNKTILQAIEELKKYLMNNPLSCIYQTPSSVQVNTTSLNDVIVPTGQEIKIGDLVLSANGYYNFVDSVGTNIVYFSSDWVSLGLDVYSITLNVDSTNTEIVNTPANFTNWIYRRVPRPNDEYLRGRIYYLEITYKDSTAFPSTQTARIDIPCNYLNAIWYQLNVDNSTTVYFDFTEDPDQQIYQLTNFTIPAGQNGVSITNVSINASNHLICTLSDGNSVDAGLLPSPVVTAGTIDSETATLGQVLTADGLGGCSWDTISTGYTHTVTIATTSGTFTDSDFANLGYGDSTIIYDDGTIKSTYKLKLETASILEFESIDATSKNNLKLIDVNKTTKAYSMTSVAMIKSATFDSGTATSGKVLTANGSGGTSWETPSGEKLYCHYITVSGTAGAVKIQVINNSNTAFTLNSLYTWYNTNISSKYIIGIGSATISSVNYLITSFRMGSSSLIMMNVLDSTLNNGSQTFTANSIDDVVVPIN